MPDNRVTLTTDAENLTKDEFDELQSDLKKTQDELESLGKSAKDSEKKTVNAITKIKDEINEAHGSFQDLAVVSGAVSVGLSLIVKSSIDSALRMEQLDKALVSVAGSTEQANRQMTRLRQVAQLPGLGLEEAVKGSINLQSVGISSQFAAEALTQVGNSLARVGAGREELFGVILGMRQMVSAGKVLQEELNQMSSRIPDLNKILIETFGSARAEDLQKMGVTVDQFLKVMVEGLGELDRVGATASNSIENLRDSITQIQAKFGQVFLPVLQRVLDTTSSLLDKINSLSDTQTNIIAWSTAFTAGITGLVTTSSAFVALLPTLRSGVKALGTAMVFLATNPISLLVGAIIATGGIIWALNRYIRKSDEAVQATDRLSEAMTKGSKQAIELATKQAEEQVNKLVNRRRRINRELEELSKSVGTLAFDEDTARRMGQLSKESERLNSQIRELEIRIREAKRTLEPESTVQTELETGLSTVPPKETEQKRIDELRDLRKKFADEIVQIGKDALEIQSHDEAQELALRLEQFKSHNSEKIENYQEYANAILLIEESITNAQNRFAMQAFKEGQSKALKEGTEIVKEEIEKQTQIMGEAWLAFYRGQSEATRRATEQQIRETGEAWTAFYRGQSEATRQANEIRQQEIQAELDEELRILGNQIAKEEEIMRNAEIAMENARLERLENESNLQNAITDMQLQAEISRRNAIQSSIENFTQQVTQSAFDIIRGIISGEENSIENSLKNLFLNFSNLLLNQLQTKVSGSIANLILGQGAGFGLGNLGSLFGTGGSLAAAGPALGIGIGALVAGKTLFGEGGIIPNLKLFDSPSNDLIAFNRGRLTGGRMNLPVQSSRSAKDFSDNFSKGFIPQFQQAMQEANSNQPVNVQVKLEVTPMVMGNFLRFSERKKKIEIRRGLIEE